MREESVCEPIRIQGDVEEIQEKTAELLATSILTGRCTVCGMAYADMNREARRGHMKTEQRNATRARKLT